MLRHAIVSLVVRCTRHAWVTVIAATLLGVISGIYAAQHFAINTDINKLISPELGWRQREIAFEQAFPQHLRSILVVVEAPTAELTSQATAALVDRLNTNKALFKSIAQPGGGEFFRKNGLLFLPLAETERVAGQLVQAEPLIAQLATDPSLRGLIEVLQMGLTGVEMEKITLDALLRPLTVTADTVDAVMANKPVNFSWHELLNPTSPDDAHNSKRAFIDIQPKLDFTALEPGKEATDAIRQAVTDLKLPTDYSARVRLTGPVPIADEEFATVQEGMVVNGIATVVIVLVILWLALKSGRIILAVFVNLIIGLAITAALGFLIVGPLNLISIAFAVLFVGLGVDFGIQYSVRYRADRFAVDDLKLALVHAARNAGAPLTLAAAATAAGFLSFLPTDYRGVSELGQIAGMGMLVAYLTSITLLPALLKLLNPKGEPEPLGFSFLAPVDKFMEDHRIAIIVGVAIVSLGGLPLLYYLQFDFNPINLRSPKVELIATFLDLRRDPITGASAISVLAPNLEATKPIEERLAKLPEVSQVRTLNFFVPPDQDKKLAAIAKARDEIEPSFKPDAAQPPPTDEENVTALNEVATTLKEAAEKHKGQAAPAAKRLSDLLAKLATATPEMRQNVANAFLRPLKTALADLQDLLQAHPVALADVPNDIAELWRTPDGRARVEVLPKGDPNDNETLRRFARAVVKVQPDATGGPVSILESGDTIVKAFFEAGAWALISIAILLWIVLRRFGDVLLTIVPLLLAGVVTLELCVVIGMPLNFANIIALPLLLGIGVAFKIYYIMAWRAGQTGLLQSSLTRAVFYSALTTATAFGSLWLSSHPGTSSMGKLLALSLLTTLAAAVLFQPVLMGKPRELGEM